MWLPGQSRNIETRESAQQEEPLEGLAGSFFSKLIGMTDCIIDSTEFTREALLLECHVL